MYIQNMNFLLSLSLSQRLCVNGQILQSTKRGSHFVLAMKDMVVCVIVQILSLSQFNHPHYQAAMSMIFQLLLLQVIDHNICSGTALSTGCLV